MNRSSGVRARSRPGRTGTLTHYPDHGPRGELGAPAGNGRAGRWLGSSHAVHRRLQRARDVARAPGPGVLRGDPRAPRPHLDPRRAHDLVPGHAGLRRVLPVAAERRDLHDRHHAHDRGLPRGPRAGRLPRAAVDHAPRRGGRRDHLRVHRHRGRDHHQRGRERAAGGKADAGGRRGAERSLHRLRIRSRRLHRHQGAGPHRAPVRRHRRHRPVAGAGGGRRAPDRDGRCHRRRDAAPGRDRAGARPHHDGRFGRQQRLRDAVGTHPEPAAVHRRARQRRRRGGEDGPGRREPDRVALHDGRAADRGAGHPAARGRLHRRRALARQPLVLARGGGGDRREPARWA